MESSLRGHYQQQQQQQQQHHQNYPPTNSSRSALSNSLSGGHRNSHQQPYHNHSSSHQINDYASVGSYYSRGSHASSQQSSQVDEAARRLGHRLSMRAHGDHPSSRPQRLSRIGMTARSGFVRYGDQMNATNSNTSADDGIDTDGNSQTTPAGSVNRTAKVAKTRYSDHGDHHRHANTPRGGNIVRKMTINVADFFRVWQKEAASAAGKGRKKRQSPTSLERREDLSPQRFAFSQLDLDGQKSQNLQQSQKPPTQQQQQRSTQQQPSSSSSSSHHHHTTTTTNQQLHHQLQQHQQQLHQRHHSDNDHHSLFSTDKEPGGLTAVIENASLTSTTSKKTSIDNDSLRSLRSLPSANSSIATKESLDKTPHPQGKCLTQPSAPAGNNELDNVEGNLIVHENDTMSLTRKQIHVLTKDKMKHAKRADFQILGLLGQGTFAQVFQCLHVQTGSMVAVKVVKNKPAYTRQAAVEIDVFRALVKKPEKNVSSSQSHRVASSPSLHDDSASTASNANTPPLSTKWEHMVDLVCYFMYKSHLCLVFEMLGLNLYEVLKRRQFRGLPLNIVRKLLKQAVGGVKELAKKSIVHCDIKPENILLAKEHDAESVVGAGEYIRRTSKDGGSTTGSKGDKEIIDGASKAIQGNLNQTLKTLKGADKYSESPGNSLGTAGTIALTSSPGIKLIDFGSACFEGQTAHTYIQSRFYRSPEVLIGLPYDSAIDMWSLGCVAAELFLGLPILPGVHEHDQLSRVSEMVAKLPDWMLEQGSKSSKYYVKYMPRSESTDPSGTPHSPGASHSRKPKWRLQTQQEYISSLSPNEIRKKGGLAKLEKQPTNRYFKKKKLADIIMHKGLHGKPEDTESLELFIHFLYGILDPDPWKRWTAHQASQHPFVAGGTVQRRSQGAPFGEPAKEQNQANSVGDIYWDPPWDPGICRRKLLNVQKMREKQNAARRGTSSYRNHNNMVPSRPSSTSSEGSADRAYSSRTPTHTEMGSQQGLGAALAAQGLGSQIQRGQFPMSSSLSDYPNSQGGRFGNDNASVTDMSGQQLYHNGGQSYTDGSYTGPWQGSVTESEFAYALQRPGVVPMGGSVASVDLSVGQNSHIQQASVGSYGGNRGPSSSGHRQNQNALSSRSYGGDGAEPGADSRRFSLGAAPGSLGQQAGSAMGQQIPGSLGQQTAGSFGQHPPGSLGQAQSSSFMRQGMYGNQSSSIPQSIDANLNTMNQIGNLSQESLLGADPAFAQAYLQQQHAALQQQQALLQQQQAALALQQEQLRTYGMNPGLLNLNTQNMGNLAAGGMNQFGQQQQLGMVGQQQMMSQQQQQQMMMGQQQMMAQQPQQQQQANNNGYYYVTAADGTPMLVTNQGMQQQQQQDGQYGMPQNYQNHDGGGY